MPVCQHPVDLIDKKALEIKKVCLDHPVINPVNHEDIPIIPVKNAHVSGIIVSENGDAMVLYKKNHPSGN